MNLNDDFNKIMADAGVSMTRERFEELSGAIGQWIGENIHDLVPFPELIKKMRERMLNAEFNDVIIIQFVLMLVELSFPEIESHRNYTIQ